MPAKNKISGPRKAKTFGKLPITIRAACLTAVFTLVGALIAGVFQLWAALLARPTPTTSTSVPSLAGATSALPASMASTFAPIEGDPTSTMTPSPFPSATTVPEAISFEAMLTNCPDIRKRLGPTKTNDPNADQNIAYQEFEGNGSQKGVMIYRASAEKDSAISVLFPDGTWLTYPDKWKWEMPHYSTEQNPPAGYFRPVHGFEFVWLEIQANELAHRKLNWATTCEIAGDSMMWRFNEGRLFQFVSWIDFTYYPDATICPQADMFDHIGQTYVLFYSPGTEENTGTWLDITSCKDPQ